MSDVVFSTSNIVSLVSYMAFHKLSNAFIVALSPLMGIVG